MYLLDTNACLDFLLSRQPAIVPRIRRAYRQLAVSAVSAAELRVGNRSSQNPDHDARQVDLFLAGVRLAAFDDAAAMRYGELMKVLTVRRTNFDRLIAAHALALGAVLVTNNEQDFQDVPGLQIENWTK